MMIKPQDLAVALQLLLAPGQPFRELAHAVGVSPGEAHNAVQRLIAARLVRAPDRSVRVEALYEFLAGGVPYLYRIPGPLYPGAQRVAERSPVLAALLAELDRLRHGGAAERPTALNGIRDTVVRETATNAYRARSVAPVESRPRVVRLVSRDTAASDNLDATTTAGDRLMMLDELSRRMWELTGEPRVPVLQRRVVALRPRILSRVEHDRA
jgi:DNA-binding Lrp family transcriptional regulator